MGVFFSFLIFIINLFTPFSFLSSYFLISSLVSSLYLNRSFTHFPSFLFSSSCFPTSSSIFCLSLYFSFSLFVISFQSPVFLSLLFMFVFSLVNLFPYISHSSITPLFSFLPPSLFSFFPFTFFHVSFPILNYLFKDDFLYCLLSNVTHNQGHHNVIKPVGWLICFKICATYNK